VQIEPKPRASFMAIRYAQFCHKSFPEFWSTSRGVRCKKGKYMIKRKVGLVFIIISVVFFLINRFYGFFLSNVFGEMFCGNRYMQPVNGIIGDVSCGFNADMYFVVFSLVVLLIGIVLVITTKPQK
jgi:hypothetical protein